MLLNQPLQRSSDSSPHVMGGGGGGAVVVVGWGGAGVQACSLGLRACAQAYGHGSDRLALLCALRGALCSHLNLGD